jgi:hypothetical protein
MTMITHTKPAPVLAHSGRLMPEDLLLDTEARAVWLTVTNDKSVMRYIGKQSYRWVIYRLRKTENRSCPLELLGRLIVWLANAGVSEAALHLTPLYLTRVIENCFAGRGHRSLDEIDRHEQQIEARENELALERRIAGVNPDRLEAEALANEQEAAVNTERSRVLRRKARQLRSAVLPFPSPAPS